MIYLRSNTKFDTRTRDPILLTWWPDSKFNKVNKNPKICQMQQLIGAKNECLARSSDWLELFLVRRSSLTNHSGNCGTGQPNSEALLDWSNPTSASLYIPPNCAAMRGSAHVYSETCFLLGVIADAIYAYCGFSSLILFMSCRITFVCRKTLLV